MYPHVTTSSSDDNNKNIAHDYAQTAPHYNNPHHQAGPATGVPVLDYNYNYPQQNYVPPPPQHHQQQPPPSPPPYIAAHPHIPHNNTKVEWSTGLFDCFSDFQNCFITFWCPCITFGQIAEIVDNGSTSCGASGALYTLITCLTGTGCIYSCLYRSKMRRQYMLEESPCWDWLVHFCCEPCALCQEYRELHNRGFDMLIGWQGNVERRNSAAAGVPMTPIPTAPPVVTMNR